MLWWRYLNVNYLKNRKKVKRMRLVGNVEILKKLYGCFEIE
jgi:hypothetical protein